MRNRQTDIIHKIYLKYKKLIIFNAMNYTRDPHKLEDIVHESVLALKPYEKKLQKMDENSLKNYVCEVARNTAKNYLKNWRNEFAFEDIEIVRSENIDTENYIAQKLDLMNILKSLPKDMYEILKLKDYFGYDYKKIAKILNISNEAARKRYSRAKERLIEELKSTDKSDGEKYEWRF
ncbi:MAG: sigma-70 family RNA polymerase sigma factor [Tissierellia bacterium]|nr:sigma-70 family RNA polymerase sigma factor [Tissierellia bacterium]